MKNLLLFFGILLFVACSKKEPENIVEPQMLSFEASKTEILLGESVTLNWEGIGDYATINGTVVPISGSLGVTPTNTIQYQAVAWNSEGWKSNPGKSVLINVTQPIVYNRTDTLCNLFYWKVDSTLSFSTGYWTKTNYYDYELDYRINYYPDGSIIMTRPDGTVVGNSDHWSWKGLDSIQKSSEAYKYNFRADTTLVLNSRNNTLISYYKGYPK
ncbi:MAG: hypothetical protein KKG99_08750 [Bacteroidetes bacterium]|nr:hypothetical protein [Bacteroidota bacterium]